MSNLMIWGDVTLTPTGFSLVELVKIGVGAILAGIAATIAYRQSLTARSKLRLDLFEKRWKVYSATQDIILALNRHNITPNAHQDFARAIQGARWIFNEHVGIYLHSILDNLTRYLIHQERIRGRDVEGQEVNEDVDRALELFVFIASQAEGRDSPLDKILGPFLTIDQPTYYARIGKWLSKSHKK